MKKIYGNENTNLVLTDKAFAVYSNTDPVKIIEKESEDGFLYDMRGIMDRDDMTAEEVNEFLESLAEPDMEKLDNITTETYAVGNFRVDVVTTEETYEAFIYHKDYGVKSLMFGLPKWQQDYDEALRVIEANIPDYVESYAEEYMEE